MSGQKIPDDFLLEEERSGYLVSSMMKRVWAAELVVLAEVDRICKAHGITYFADYGTLIGAVRHHGFIPWDDDIDISMKRADYMKFLSVARNELKEPYLIHSYFVREDHDQPFSVIMNRETVGGYDEITEAFYGCPFIVGVEVYPMDYFPRDAAEAEVLIPLYQAVYDCVEKYHKYRENGELEERVKKIREFTGVPFSEDQSLLMQLWQLADRIASMYREEEADDLVMMYDFALFESPHRRRKEWFSSSVELPFENTTIPVPVGYEEFLRSKYGDFMTPVPKSASHEYPFYRKQLPGLPERMRNEILKEDFLLK